LAEIDTFRVQLAVRLRGEMATMGRVLRQPGPSTARSQLAPKDQTSTSLISDTGHIFYILCAVINRPSCTPPGAPYDEWRRTRGELCPRPHPHLHAGVSAVDDLYLPLESQSVQGKLPPVPPRVFNLPCILHTEPAVSADPLQLQAGLCHHPGGRLVLAPR
jgi:hypothetical protein